MSSTEALTQQSFNPNRLSQKSRNRKRSKRRAIYCPVHGCYLDSASQKHYLFADKAEHLQQRGIGRKRALTIMAHHSTVPLAEEWLESFWCSECQACCWYHVRKLSCGNYELFIAPREMWQQVSGVNSTWGNPSVSEFTLRHAYA